VGSRERCEGRQRADELRSWKRGGGVNTSNEEPRPGGGLSGSPSGGARAQESTAFGGSSRNRGALRSAGRVLVALCSALSICALQSNSTDQVVGGGMTMGQAPARRRAAGRALTPRCALQPSLLARRCSEVRRRPTLLVRHRSLCLACRGWPYCSPRQVQPRGPRPSPSGGRPPTVRQTGGRTAWCRQQGRPFAHVSHVGT